MVIRFPLMALAGLALLAALGAGLVRLGWALYPLNQSLAINHGPLMVIGFLGTLIGIERAVALTRRWPYGAPLFSGLAALAALLGLPPGLAGISAMLGSLFLVFIFIFIYRLQPALAAATMVASAALWFTGNLLWTVGYPLHEVVPWWVAFLVLTIAGERLELSRLLRLSEWDQAKFVLACGLLLAGLLISLFNAAVGVWINGVGLVTLALWLLRYDIAWRTVRYPGPARFMAICLLLGYVWLGLAGTLWMSFTEFFTAGLRYDAMLHSIFVGFVFSMIFAHAPIILPSVTGFAMPFQQLFYGHLVLLHLSLLLRVGGDLAESQRLQKWGGLINALAILLFLANNVRAVKRGNSHG
jgi:hypothetical protein